MIVKTQIDKIEKFGEVQDSTKFSIKISRKAFEILSGLYSDKPLAIVRELGCNAMDSHVSAGKGDVPIRVHLPNSMEPYLIIEDEGLGLRHEDIVKIYSTYFESTKTESNDAVGCLGLGSKSPFCYTDNFTVTSRFDGVETIYLAYFDEDGAPTLDKASSHSTNLVNGVSIQIPINRDDISKFVTAAEKAFRWFTVRPIITGAELNYGNTASAIASKSGDWLYVVTAKSDYYASPAAVAIMGGIAYPVDSNKIPYEQQSFLKNLVVHFKIGELDFTPSRESLKYDEATVAAIVKRVKEVAVDLQELAQKKIAEAPFLNEAFTIYNDLPAVCKTNNLSQKYLWKGSPLVANKVLQDKFELYSLHSTRGGEKMRLGWACTHLSQLNFSSSKRAVFTYFSTKTPNNWKAICFFNEMKAKDSSVNQVINMTEDNKARMIAAGFDPALFTALASLDYKRTVNASGTRNTVPVPVISFPSRGYYNTRPESINLDDAVTNGAKYYIFKAGNGKTEFSLVNGSLKPFHFDQIMRLLNDIVIDDKAKTKLSAQVIAVHPSKEDKVIAAGLIPLLDHFESFVNNLTDAEVIEFAKRSKVRISYSGLLKGLANLDSFIKNKDAELKDNAFFQTVKDLFSTNGKLKLDECNKEFFFNKIIQSIESLVLSLPNVKKYKAASEDESVCFEGLKVLNQCDIYMLKTGIGSYYGDTKAAVEYFKMRDQIFSKNNKKVLYKVGKRN